MLWIEVYSTNGPCTCEISPNFTVTCSAREDFADNSLELYTSEYYLVVVYIVYIIKSDYIIMQILDKVMSMQHVLLVIQ